MNSVNTFNAINEPWVDVITNDGTTIQLGLKETLLQAHLLQQVINSLFLCRIPHWRDQFFP